ncbi:SNF2 family N-terminal domain containing protein [Amanita muscaria]
MANASIYHHHHTERDELDCFSAMDPTLFYSTPHRQPDASTNLGITLKTNASANASRSTSSSSGPLRRSGRERKQRVEIGAVTLTNPKPAATRKRALSISSLQNGLQTAESAVKKLRIDEKKAQTVASNEKRDARERARKKWVYHYKRLFEPLLPSSSSYFESLGREVEKLETKAIIPFHELYEQPASIKEAVLKDYQLYGLSYLVWMYKNGINCILGDEMGLGKTLQTLSLFAWIKEHEKGDFDPHLVVCPLSVLQSWENEVARWVPSLTALRFHGIANERTRIKEGLRRGEIELPHIMLTTYETFAAEDSWIKSRRWTYCVLDEGHKIKNAATNIAGKLSGLGCLHRLILTGTPVQNNLVELWALLHWLYPNVFTPASERPFKDSFDLNKGAYDISFLNAAKDLVSKIMLRRTKSTVEINVPPREEMTVFVPLTEAQRFWTYRMLTRMDTAELEEIFEEGAKIQVEDETTHEGRQEVLSILENQMKQEPTVQNNRYKKLMNLLLQLRRVCDHPYLLPNAEPETHGLGEHLVASSSKLIAIDKLLADILPKGERVLIFSQWTGMLDVLEDFLLMRSIKYARLDGSTHRPRRTLDIKLFQMEKSPYQVFMMTTKAGGLGINLTKATTVVMCDSDWNPQNDLQAIARAHRIGQTKVVKVYRLICRGSVEDQMLNRIRRKLFLSLKIMDSSNNSTSQNVSLGSSELLDILRKGSSALARFDDGMDLGRFLDASIDDILQDSKKVEDMRNVKIQHDMGGVNNEEHNGNDARLLEDAEEEERRLLSGVIQVQSRFFEGKVVHRQNADIANEWSDLVKRARVDRTVTVDGMTFIISPAATPEPEEVKKPLKRERVKFESEEWCNICRDGGDLVLCDVCPRVFHASCYGITKRTIAFSARITCSQHSCAVCERKTSDAGGLLFRCQTCHQAFCEDCLPFDDIEPVGETLPELELLGYGAKTAAYFIRCHDCIREFKENPEYRKSWEQEFRQTQRKLERKLKLEDVL